MLISDKQYEVPDACLKDECKFKDDMLMYGQNAICGRCPLLTCIGSDKYGPMVPAEEYRSDWAKQWHLFFKGEIEYPILYLEFKEDDIQE